VGLSGLLYYLLSFGVPVGYLVIAMTMPGHGGRHRGPEKNPVTLEKRPFAGDAVQKENEDT
jgi:hypothetical protein